MRFEVASCREMVKLVNAESVDLILTDPPYPREYLGCWDELADFAGHALKPGGFLVAMYGQVDLPRVVASLGKSGLLYQWAFPYRSSARLGVVWGRCVMSQHKMVLWYVKEPRPDKTEWGLVIDSFKADDGLQDMRYHKWGQDTNGFLRLLTNFARGGKKVVCDPFLGGGTTALVCQAMGYDFIGSDIDAECVETTKRRLEVDGVDVPLF